MHIEIVWRDIRRKTFRGKDRLQMGKRFVKKLKQDEDAEEIMMFDVRGDATVAYYDIDTFEREEMDG